jgi:hypothetical protein
METRAAVDKGNKVATVAVRAEAVDRVKAAVDITIITTTTIMDRAAADRVMVAVKATVVDKTKVAMAAVKVRDKDLKTNFLRDI